MAYLVLSLTTNCTKIKLSKDRTLNNSSCWSTIHHRNHWQGRAI